MREGAPDIVIPALERLLEQSPAFMRGSPVILGLDELPKGAVVDFAGLVEGLRRLKLIPVGAAGGPASLRQAAAAAGLAQFTKGQKPESSTAGKCRKDKLRLGKRASDRFWQRGYGW